MAPQRASAARPADPPSDRAASAQENDPAPPASSRWRRVARTLVTVVLPIVVLVIILTRIDIAEIGSALATSSWRWVAVAAALGAVTYVGAGVAFAALAPVRIPIAAATLVHAAGAFVSMAAPAGVGSAALNLRMLSKRGVRATLGIATVALIQVVQLAVTVAILLVLSVASGKDQLGTLAPGRTSVIVTGVLVVLVGVAFLVPRVRRWLVRRIGTSLRQTWPRLAEVVRQPGRVALAVAGSAVVSLGYVFAFDACLSAFGQHLGLVQVALVYLVGNTAGAIVPSPGGVGTIEVTLIGGLTAAGIGGGAAASVVIIFRLVTFWLPVPLGWVALHRLRRTGEL